ncbi:MAG: hypothetical protein ABSH25_17750, partial [Syntrophorhabdales bacterium]
MADSLRSRRGASGFFFGDQALAADYGEEVLRAAPLARFWASAASAGRNCGACHDPTERLTSAVYSHPDKMVKCLLCA